MTDTLHYVRSPENKAWKETGCYLIVAEPRGGNAYVVWLPYLLRCLSNVL